MWLTPLLQESPWDPRHLQTLLSATPFYGYAALPQGGSSPDSGLDTSVLPRHCHAYTAICLANPTRINIATEATHINIARQCMYSETPLRSGSELVFGEAGKKRRTIHAGGMGFLDRSTGVVPDANRGRPCRRHHLPPRGKCN